MELPPPVAEKLNRAKQARSALFGDDATMARELGIPYTSLRRALEPDPAEGARVSTLEKRVNQIGEALITKKGVSRLWWERGEGDPPQKGAEPSAAGGRDEPQTTAEAHESAGFSREEAVEVPYFPDGPGAGKPRVLGWNGEPVRMPLGLVRRLTGGDVSDGLYWTRVEGTSMEPWLPDRSPILVQRATEVRDGGRFVIYLDDEDGEVVKRIERLGGKRILLVSDNPAHSTRLLKQVKGGDPHTYEDLTHGHTLQLRIGGRVIYPPDTPHATLRTFAREMGEVLKQLR